MMETIALILLWTIVILAIAVAVSIVAVIIKIVVDFLKGE